MEWKLPPLPGVHYLFPYQSLVIHNLLGAQGFFEPEQGSQEFPSSQVVLLPTGAGKSLCFTVPLILSPRLTLIIYPLLALMRDQERRFKDSGIAVALLQGGQTKKQRSELFQQILKGEISLILTSPETLSSPSVLKALTPLGITHLVVDEAHCISQWGQTFRPHYRLLGQCLRQLKIPQVTAFTATASPQILIDLEKDLFNGSKPHLIKGNPDRPNLYFSVHRVLSTPLTVLEILKKCQYPVLIFFTTRKGAEMGARRIQNCLPNKEVKFYHAGLEKPVKLELEAWFFASSEGILCSTNAYGLGLDKKNIRTVIHWEESYSPEGFLQEAGRGGRDGKPAQSHLVTSIRNPVFSRIYPRDDQCRRTTLLAHLDSVPDHCNGCDVCNCKHTEFRGDKNLSKQLKALSRRGLLNDIDLFFWGRGPGLIKNKNLTGLRGYGDLSDYPLEFIQYVLEEMEAKKIIGYYEWGPWKGKLWVRV